MAWVLVVPVPTTDSRARDRPHRNAIRQGTLTLYERYLEAARHPHLRFVIVDDDEQLDVLLAEVLRRGGLRHSPRIARLVLPSSTVRCSARPPKVRPDHRRESRCRSCCDRLPDGRRQAPSD